MMPVLIAIALKSLLIAGLTVAMLELMKRRSAAQRSSIAHIGLLALILLALAPLALPSWNVEAPALLGTRSAATTPADAPATKTTSALTDSKAVTTIAPALKPVLVKAAASQPSISATAAAVAFYAVPAAILLFITALALARLVTLRARADVLVDGHWLSALARAQRRMGFKHGTALLTSDELASPVSWGLMRPVIVLNTRAVEASGEAEAIIAHELAHVARMDWVKLLLARVATAMFWFNPLVWMLAREAHQLREEAADDAVLAADIADTDYAQLLVGVARHECPGLLLGAHGVAPSKSSLARRVARVLDVKSVRGPAARPFVAGVLAGAVMVAAPVAALTLTPGSTKEAPSATKIASPTAYYPQKPEVPADLPHLIADGVTTAMAAVTPAQSDAQKARAQAIAEAVESAARARETALANAAIAKKNARMALAEATDAGARANDARARANDAKARAKAANVDVDVDGIIQMKTAGVTPDYVNAMRAVSPALRSLELAEFVALKSVGIDPGYARDLADAGLRNLDEEDLIKAKSIGLTANYVRGMVRAGLRPDIDAFVQLKSVGVPVDYVAGISRSGHRGDADKIVQMWAVGVKPEDMAVPAAPRQPRPPRPPRTDHRGLPAASPPDWKTPGSDPGG
jgi:bla regulator protein blaR1